MYACTNEAIHEALGECKPAPLPEHEDVMILGVRALISLKVPVCSTCFNA